MQIIDALAAGDAELVEKLCREHLKMEANALISAMEKRGFWPNDTAVSP